MSPPELRATRRRLSDAEPGPVKTIAAPLGVPATALLARLVPHAESLPIEGSRVRRRGAESNRNPLRPRAQP